MTMGGEVKENRSGQRGMGGVADNDNGMHPESKAN